MTVEDSADGSGKGTMNLGEVAATSSTPMLINTSEGNSMQGVPSVPSIAARDSAAALLINSGGVPSITLATAIPNNKSDV